MLVVYPTPLVAESLFIGFIFPGSRGATVAKKQRVRIGGVQSPTTGTSRVRKIPNIIAVRMHVTRQLARKEIVQIGFNRRVR